MKRDYYVKIFVILSILPAWFIGNRNARIFSTDELGLIEKFSIDSLVYGSDYTEAYRVGELVGLISSETAKGYGGPMEVAVLTDPMNRIKYIELIQDRETVAYITKLRRKRYFGQYIGKSINDGFIYGEDINAVSGATLSSVAIAEAVRNSVHQIAHEKNLEIQPIPVEWQFGYREILVAIIFIIGVISIITKQKRIRYLSLFSSFVVIGFLLNESLSITHFGRVLLGFIPDFNMHFAWWLLMAGTLAIIIGFGRNVYCHALCPFSATQILLHKISGLNFRLPHTMQKIARYTPGFLLWLSIMIILISRNPTLASYEPFAMFFSLNGIGIQWYILPVSLIGSLFVSNFFCNLFCPVGAGFRFLLSIRRIFINPKGQVHEETAI